MVFTFAYEFYTIEYNKYYGTEVDSYIDMYKM